MKSIVQVFPMLLLLLLGLGLGHWLASAFGENNQILNQHWDHDSWEEAAEEVRIVQIMEPEEEDDDDMLLLDSTESSLAKTFLRDNRVMHEEVAEESSHKEDKSYMSHVQLNRDCNVVMAQQVGQSKNTCKVKHTFVQTKQNKEVCHSRGLLFKKENKCYLGSEPVKFTVCQLMGDIVIPKKCYYRKAPMVVTITIECSGVNPYSYNY